MDQVANRIQSTFDTLSYANELKAVGVTEEQAKVQRGLSPKNQDVKLGGHGVVRIESGCNILMLNAAGTCCNTVRCTQL